MGRFRILRRLKDMERKYSYRFLLLCHSPTTPLIHPFQHARPPIYMSSYLSSLIYLTIFSIYLYFSHFFSFFPIPYLLTD